MADQQKSKRPQAPTKDEMRQMLAQAVRNTQPGINVVKVPEKGSAKLRSRQR
jgi:hypothetical protein